MVTGSSQRPSFYYYDCLTTCPHIRPFTATTHLFSIETEESIAIHIVDAASGSVERLRPFYRDVAEAVLATVVSTKIATCSLSATSPDVAEWLVL
jgi:hypothetical protein